jgi:hypothetical protein
MYHLDNSSGIDVMPAPKRAISLKQKWFTEGDAQTPPSYPGADWFNIVQAELLNVLKAGDITPQKTQLNQLSDAIRRIITKNQQTVKFNSSTDSTSETEAATPSAVKKAYDLAAGAVKISGDEMTGQLRMAAASAGIKFKYAESNNEFVLRTLSNSLSFIFYDEQIKKWSTKLAYITDKKQWCFLNVDDVTINNKSVLKTGDYGIGAATGAIAENFDDHLVGGFYQCRTTDFSDLQLSGNSTATLLAYPSTTATWKIEQLSVVNSKEPRIYYRCDTKEGKQKWHEAITTANICDFLPVGIPQPWPATTPPDGWLKCNGWKFDKNKYPKLAQVYPSGNLPDLRGEFIRGWDDGKGTDPGRGILSWQSDAIRNIYGEFAGLQQYSSGVFNYVANGKAYAGLTNNNWDKAIYAFNASNVVPTAHENRPRNLAFMYIVKAE